MPSHTEPGPAGERVPEARDFAAEFTSFLREHQVNAAVEEVYHLNPFPEEVDEIRQHNHVTMRVPQSGQVLRLCLTSYNWDDLPVNPSDVIKSLATEASIFEMADGSFVDWCSSLGWSADSRAAERKFRHTFEMVKILRQLLGDAAYGGLLKLQAEVAAELEIEDVGEDWEENGDGVGRL